MKTAQRHQYRPARLDDIPSLFVPEARSLVDDWSLPSGLGRE